MPSTLVVLNFSSPLWGLRRDSCGYGATTIALIPVRAHFGAVINFQAGTVVRSPPILRKIGLEWLWRIKEEPYLWQRYWNDGKALLHLLVTRVLPLAIWRCWWRITHEHARTDLIVQETHIGKSVILHFSGPATASHIDKIIQTFRAVIGKRKEILIDLSSTRVVDARFLGTLIMFRKALRANGAALRLNGLSPRLEWLFRLHCLDFLISTS